MRDFLVDLLLVIGPLGRQLMYAVRSSMLMVRMIWQGSGQRVSSMLMVRMSWQGSWLLGCGQSVRFLREQVMLVGRVWVRVRWNMKSMIVDKIIRHSVSAF